MVAAAIVLALSALAAVRAGGAAVSFFPSVNLDEPLIPESAPLAAPAPPRQSRRLILVVIDGLRLRDSFGVPFLDELRRRGIDAAATSHYPTISRPNYVTLLTGVPPHWSGVRNNAWGAPVHLDSIMDRARARGLSAASVADYSDGLGYMFAEDFDDVRYATWPGGFEKSSRGVLERGYDFVVLLPGAVDAAGHEHGADSQEYRSAIASVDRALGEALSDVDYERDTVIVVSDHGHTDEGGHGGTEPNVLEVPLILAGAGVRPGAVLAEKELVSVAPTVAALLGLSPPRQGFGRTLTGALELAPEDAGRIEVADELRRLKNLTLASAAAERGRRDRGRTRLFRLLLTGGLGVLALLVLSFARRVGAVHLDWRVLLVAVPAFPLSYYALLEMFGQQFSLSAVKDQGDIAALLLRFGLASTAVHVVASWMALRGRVVLRDRLAAANALTLCGIVVAWLPAALMWAVFAAPPFVDLPGSALMVLVPATFIAVACFAVASAVVLGLEIVIFFARAVDPRLGTRLRRTTDLRRRRLEADRE